MSIRFANYADLVPASKCLAAAFKDEHMYKSLQQQNHRNTTNKNRFGIYMHPHRHSYPEDMYLQFLKMVRNAYFSGPDSYVLVSYDDTETITGLAHWRRLRSNPPTPTWSRTFIKTCVNWYNYFESFIYPNRASEPSHLSILGQLGPFAAPFWTGSRSEVWDLTLLGVDSAHGGKGYGRELVKWGFERAREEGVGCSVMASEGKEGFYRSCGFDVLVGNVRDNGGMENPCNLNDIPGGAALFWDNGREGEGGGK
ncbi:hypothetical protein HII31_05687 [Pseudocercospora fuligena]|uniref:N-acetyltransferase domain-containing protein n=1 Tax=Pseudocercospora fuligena TaxID=685502 RepID=A0A8H6RL03_9PEZI|nr:hypothetical protein HII31_05687 [Pseudocercospora fuligena]